MGSHYTSITLRGPEQKDVLRKLQDLRRTAFISPTVNGFTTVYDAECERNIEVRSVLSRELSEHFSCPALAVVNFDDDILTYHLYVMGNLIDEYDSSPNYWTNDIHKEPSGPEGGDSELLVEIMGTTGAVAEVEDILSKSIYDEDGYAVELERHYDLAEYLGLPVFTADKGYYLIADGDIPDGYEKEDFIEIVGDFQPEK